MPLAYINSNEHFVVVANCLVNVSFGHMSLLELI